jgi:signal transduction histidine kinase
MSDNIFVVLLISMGGVFTLVVSFVIIFIRNQNKLLKQRAQLQQAELQHQQELLKTVIVSQEEERKRIGQDLHDDVGTALSNLRITIEMFNQDAIANRADFSNTSKRLIDKVIQDVRHISHNLSPPGIELYGFMGALEDMCEFITLSGKLHIHIDNQTGAAPDELSQAAAISLYRVMEELLNNTIKHANASRVDVTFAAADDSMLVTYRDDGRGIPANVKAGKGMGRQNIESRLGIIGAGFTVESSPGAGFAMHITIKKQTAN